MTRSTTGAGIVWSVVVPVKRLDRAKTRLDLPQPARTELALAMAQDTVAAALAAPSVGEVVVVTDDRRAGGALGALGARVVADRPDAGLNPALRHGMQQASYDAIGFLSSDLPALRADGLQAVLEAASGHGFAVVADVDGTGTTLLTTRRGPTATPRFGPGSFAAHLAAGAVDLTEIAVDELRQDVDTLDGLRRALQLGVGQCTARQAIASTAVGG